MTNLYDGRLVDIISNAAARNPEVEALAFALRAEKRRIMDYAKQTCTISMIDELPEPILDVLAVELRSPYYNDAATIQEKRDIIRSSLLWAYRAGTVSAMEEMCMALFGNGRVVEWFNAAQDEGEFVPGEFDIETGAEMEDPQQYMARINRVIDRVKNVRSHLRKVRFLRVVHTPETGKVLPQSYPAPTVGNCIAVTARTGAPQRQGAFVQSVPQVAII